MSSEIIKFTILMALAAVGIWAKCKAIDNLVAQHPELDEEEEN